jgi:hypothetical protein
MYILAPLADPASYLDDTGQRLAQSGGGGNLYRPRDMFCPPHFYLKTELEYSFRKLVG